jgi:D-beta-D-heptose 7-phosphate kinase/D-beta-D-heptose 1-phosphate adenosyltransferase
MPKPHYVENRFRASKFVSSFEELTKKVDYHRGLNPNIVILVVLGTFDLIHIGHARYLAKCRELADIVIVLVDPDIAVQLAKGKDRPIIPQDERAEMLMHLEYTDYICFIENFNPQNGLWLRQLPFKPNIIVVSERKPTNQEHIKALSKIAGRVEVLESQAQTSTSNKIRSLVVNAVDKIEEEFAEMMSRVRKLFDTEKRV